MKVCAHCGADYPAERPYEVCLAADCVAARLRARAAGMTLSLQHKMGYVPQFRDVHITANKN